MPYRWVMSRRGWQECLHAIRDLAGDGVVLDLETTGLDPYEGTAVDGYPTSITMAAVTLSEGPTWVVPLQHPSSPFAGQRWQPMVVDLSRTLADAQAPLVNHNLRFDLLWLWRFSGIDLVHLLAWDTAVADYLLNENTSSRLKDVVPRIRDDVTSWADVDLSRGAHNVEWQALGHYAARDTHWTRWLWRWQQRRLAVDLDGAHAMREEAVAPVEHAAARLAVLYHGVSLPVEGALHVAERNGLLLDRDTTEAMLAERDHAARDAYAQVVAADTDLFVRWNASDPEGVSLAPTSHFFRELTSRAVDRGGQDPEDPTGLRVLALTPNRQPQWNKAVLTRLARGGSTLAEAILTWRDATKQAEFLRAWPEHVSPFDQRVHPSFRSTSTVTGRTSAANPNMQQVAKALHPAWVAPPGWLFAEIDYSQIELRVAAWVAPCEPMLEAYRRGDDLHTIMAAIAAGVPVSEVTPWMRQRAKAINFGFLYGMQAPGFVTYAADVYDVDYTLEEAHAAREGFFRTWDGLEEWHDRTARIAERTGYIVSPLGRIRRVPDAMHGDDWSAGNAIRQAINAPVQATASDLLQTAATLVAGTDGRDQPVEGVRLTGSVHDSLLLEVREDGWQERVDHVMRLMVHEVPDWVQYRLGIEVPVPLAVEAEVGQRWGDADAEVLVCG